MKARSLYECFWAKVTPDGIVCAKGHKLVEANNRPIGIKRLIRGDPLEFTVCQGCQDFESMGEPLEKRLRGWKHKLKGRSK